MDRAGPARLKTVESPLQKYPEACVWQPTSNLLVLFKFFVGYSFLVSRPILKFTHFIIKFSGEPFLHSFQLFFVSLLELSF